MIYCIGDSFTYGDELVDRNISAWPVLLGKKLNQPSTNLGKSGANIDYVLKKSIESVCAGDAKLIIIIWPNYYRKEYFLNKKVEHLWPGRILSHNADTEKQIIKILTLNQSSISDVLNYRNWVSNIILLQTFFKAHNQKYLMFKAQTLIPPAKDSKANSNLLYQDLSNHVDNTYFPDWPNNNIHDWYGKYPLGPNHHPLEEGHIAITEKIYEHIRNFGWVS